MERYFVGAVGTLLVFGVLYAGLCALIYFKQDSLIFYPVQNDSRLVQSMASSRLAIPGHAGEVEAWWIDIAGDPSASVLLYFGGNAEDVLYTAMSARQFNARALVAINYPGYGRSSGQPSEHALFAAALDAYDYLVANKSVAPESIVPMGRSLGSGVATYLAANRTVRGVVLITPYDSMTNVAREHFGYLPVSLLLKHRFESSRVAQSLDKPALLLAAEHDNVVPVAHARALDESWRGPHRLVELSGKGHNDIESHAAYYDTINKFLASLPR